MFGDDWSSSRPLSYRTVSSHLWCWYFGACFYLFVSMCTNILLGFCIGLRNYADYLWQIKTKGGKWCLFSLFPSYLSSGHEGKLGLGKLSKTLLGLVFHIWKTGTGPTHSCYDFLNRTWECWNMACTSQCGWMSQKENVFMGRDCWIPQGPRVLVQFMEVVTGDLGHLEFSWTQDFWNSATFVDNVEQWRWGGI